MDVPFGSVHVQLSPSCSEIPNKITGLWVIALADCSNMSDDYSGHAERGQVDWTPNDEIRLSSAFIIITLSYNYMCEGPEDNRLRSEVS